MTTKEIIKFLKENPLDRYVILATLLEDDTISIAELVKHKEESLRKTAIESSGIGKCMRTCYVL